MEQTNLSELTAKELQAIKSKWYSEAESGGNLWKLRLIGKQLGQNLRANYGPKWEFKYDDFRLYVDDYGNYLTLHMGDRLLCSTHNERLYIKGVVDIYINTWYPMAEEKQKEVEGEQEKKEQEKLRNQLIIN